MGRLDKDTEGLLLITNDGPLAHELLSPKKHVDKTYFVKAGKPLSDEDVRMLETGVDIGKKSRLCLERYPDYLRRGQVFVLLSERGNFIR